MKNWIWIVVLVAVATALGAQDAKKPKGMFSMLKVGQAVTVSWRAGPAVSSMGR
jgi:hypothetical protein